MRNVNLILLKGLWTISVFHVTLNHVLNLIGDCFRVALEKKVAPTTNAMLKQVQHDENTTKRGVVDL